MKRMIFLTVFLVSMLSSQLRVTSIDRITIPSTERWNNAVYSHDGKTIFLTNTDYDGIWQYTLATKLLREITRDKHSGFDFSISDNGTKLAYRRTVIEGDHITRQQEAVEISLESGSSSVRNSGNSISVPRFAGNSFVSSEIFSSAPTTSSQSSQTVTILGIENAKIALLTGNGKTIMDPLGNGQYIWPRLSPDGMNIVAVEMDRGAFITDLLGESITKIGKCNAPQWTRSGTWIIGMDDRDDGHTIISSDIIAVSGDGKTKINLTEAFNDNAMYPVCSPVENNIVFNTANGLLYLLKYEEAK